jgi:outer membrane immunogenic protein
MMKEILTGVFALVLLASNSAVFSADLPVGQVYKAPVASPLPYSWTGFYLGGNIGYSWGRSEIDITFADNASRTVLFNSNTGFDMNGLIGGGQIGYNIQTGSLVWGLEADIQASHQGGVTSFLCPAEVCSPRPGSSTPGPVIGSLNQKLEWFGTVRSRIGLPVTPTVLAYVTGGLAYGEVNTEGTLSGFTAPVCGCVLLSTPVMAAFGSNTTRVGWTIGAGIEASLWENWTAKIEYLYIDLGTIAATGVNQLSFPPIAAVFSAHVTDNIVRVGLNYSFNRTAPIIAKY